MIWILLVVLTIVGGVAAVGIAANERRKVLAGAPPQKQLGTGDQLRERTVREIRVGDVLTMEGKDYLVEGTIGYDEDGHRWVGGRLLDGSDVQWIVVGIERAGAGAIRLMRQDDATSISGYPPEAIVVGELRYALDKRGTATCELRGDLGALGEKERPATHVERCRWWLYNAPGEDTMIVEQWGADYRVLRGKKVHEGVIDLMQGS